MPDATDQDEHDQAEAAKQARKYIASVTDDGRTLLKLAFDRVLEPSISDDERIRRARDFGVLVFQDDGLRGAVERELARPRR
jgi:hypothetical protein